MGGVASVDFRPREPAGPERSLGHTAQGSVGGSRGAGAHRDIVQQVAAVPPAPGVGRWECVSGRRQAEEHGCPSAGEAFLITGAC